MITRLSHSSIYVLDQEKAYDFYDPFGNWFSLGQKDEKQ